jgi:hypothetical protein
MIRTRRLGCSSHAALMGEKRNMHEVFVGNPEEKRPFGRTKCRRNYNIKIEPENVD